MLKKEVDEAIDFFASMPNVAHPLQLLKHVGLGNLTLGQPSATLSGGDAQPEVNASRISIRRTMVRLHARESR